jgi:protein-tyrosine-phosphatase
VNDTPTLRIVTLCTGNVARSVMLGFMLTTLSQANEQGWQVRSAGTHVIEGSAMSGRTRDALLSIEELGEHQFAGHRSHQLNEDDVEWANVILASEADHVLFVQRHFSAHATEAVQLQQFVRYAPLDIPFAEQLAAVVARGPDATFDVEDPAGGDVAKYVACANELWELSQAFATIVGD